MTTKFIKILGTSAGGGLPQWNCFCRYCRLARSGKICKRTQSSIALVSDDRYTLVNASPDINSQLLYFGESVPVRKNPMENIILTDAQLDHTLGLLQIREGDPLTIYGTSVVQQQLTKEFGILPLLNYYCKTNFNVLQMDTAFTPVEGIQVTPVNIISNSPPYSILRDKVIPGSNLGLVITTENKKVFYAPGLLYFTPEILEIIAEMDHILLDGTCWTSTELSFLKKEKLEDLGHISQEGLLEILKQFDCKKTLIHINNTNPINDPKSPQAKILTDNGIEIAYDGMEIYL